MYSQAAIDIAPAQPQCTDQGSHSMIVNVCMLCTPLGSYGDVFFSCHRHGACTATVHRLSQFPNQSMIVNVCLLCILLGSYKDIFSNSHRHGTCAAPVHVDCYCIDYAGQTSYPAECRGNQLSPQASPPDSILNQLSWTCKADKVLAHNLLPS